MGLWGSQILDYFSLVLLDISTNPVILNPC